MNTDLGKNNINKSHFAQIIQEWYHQNLRDLPWRQTTDTYKIWLSEIILQQTRVNQGLPYYLRFTEYFPTIADLAHASENEVLRAWQGLGYYSRARNLHRCAKEIITYYNGIFPNSYDKLLKLPGIGPYTAAAIASFSFKEKVAAVDGNVFRVLARVFGVYDDISTGKGQNAFRQLANELISEYSPDTFNQAIMEFGATCCKPKSPDCEQCPFRLSCYAYQQNKIDELPVKTKKIKIRKRYFQYLVWEGREGVYMKSRGEKDIWQGLYDFEVIETAHPLTEEDVMNNEKVIGKNVNVDTVSVSHQFKHVLTHQVINATFYHLHIADKLLSDDLFPYEMLYIEKLPKPVLVTSYLNEYIF